MDKMSACSTSTLNLSQTFSFILLAQIFGLVVEAHHVPARRLLGSKRVRLRRSIKTGAALIFPPVLFCVILFHTHRSYARGAKITDASACGFALHTRAITSFNRIITEYSVRIQTEIPFCCRYTQGEAEHLLSEDRAVTAAATASRLGTVKKRTTHAEVAAAESTRTLQTAD
jgi:hypothetical protein